MRPSIIFSAIIIVVLIISLVAALPPSDFLKKANSSPSVLSLSNAEVSIFDSPAFAKDGVGGGHYNSSNSTAIEANITQSMRDFMDDKWTGSQ